MFPSLLYVIFTDSADMTRFIAIEDLILNCLLQIIVVEFFLQISRARNSIYNGVFLF